ncbi:GAF and ANTAR domain-containing protein [Agrococcus beijingensis]|uniref:GAF and ANTAR domain-containing protein n=1 Tax=Agrococcus beijingensis TaxID=3068634 RepID=UPI002741D29A|nr:GAF and ANTAR domain-containing protein [Agrococcus sp. REN33]
MDDEGAGRGAVGSGGMALDDAARELLAPFVELLSVNGASISVVTGPGHSTVGASDAVAARLEQLQFSLGEGPHWEALRTGQSVLVPDVHEAPAVWPVFGAAATELPVRALFAFPLTLGSASVGVVDLYRTTTGSLSRSEIAKARSLAAVAARAALRLAAAVAVDDQTPRGARAPELRRVVHQATGMLLVQLDLTASEALSRLRAHAFATGASLESVAQEVVARRLKLDDPGAGQ